MSSMSGHLRGKISAEMEAPSNASAWQEPVRIASEVIPLKDMQIPYLLLTQKESLLPFLVVTDGD